MQKTQKRIEVMKAYTEGGKIEVRSIGSKNWYVTLPSIWDWAQCDYRIVTENKLFLAYIDNAGELRRVLSSVYTSDMESWTRIPSEDKTICL